MSNLAFWKINNDTTGCSDTTLNSEDLMGANS